MKENLRIPAVAGSFYPAQESVLRRMVNDCLGQAVAGVANPIALVAPHAGYVYSGLTAAYAYKNLSRHSPFKRVIVVAPSHRVFLEGVSVGNYTAYLTPLGPVPVDTTALADLCQEPDVTDNPAAHAQEHSLEAHLPFLQETLGDFTLIPMVYGRLTRNRLAEIIANCWQPKDLLVISSDLSHFHPYLVARELDSQVHRAVLSLNAQAAQECEACGGLGIAALVDMARKRSWRSIMADYRNSGDTAGDKEGVVGYASYLFYNRPELMP